MHPIKDATFIVTIFPYRRTFQSMHPIKDATWIPESNGFYSKISIHAPYKGCNANLTTEQRAMVDFNPCTL